MYGKGFLGNMTENLQADCVQSRQAGFMQCFLDFPHRLWKTIFYVTMHFPHCCVENVLSACVQSRQADFLHNASTNLQAQHMHCFTQHHAERRTN